MQVVQELLRGAEVAAEVRQRRHEPGRGVGDDGAGFGRPLGHQAGGRCHADGLADGEIGPRAEGSVERPGCGAARPQGSPVREQPGGERLGQAADELDALAEQGQGEIGCLAVGRLVEDLQSTDHRGKGRHDRFQVVPGGGRVGLPAAGPMRADQ